MFNHCNKSTQVAVILVIAAFVIILFVRHFDCYAIFSVISSMKHSWFLVHDTKMDLPYIRPTRTYSLQFSIVRRNCRSASSL